MNRPKLAFDKKPLDLPLEKIRPLRAVREPEKRYTRYGRIVSSIQKHGLVEPLVVHPLAGKEGVYILLDGHLRFHAMQQLGITSAKCLVAHDDESFTYNAHVSRLAPIQEHRMIVKAVKFGVPIADIAETLSIDEAEIRSRLKLLNGIHSEAVELLKDKQITPSAIRVLRRVSAVRQIEMAEFMVMMNDFTKSYADALFVGTPVDQLADPERGKKIPNLSAEEVARMERELESIERDFKAVESNYGENMLNLTVIVGYMRKLLDNAGIVKFLRSRHADLSAELERVASSEVV
jgi:ParB-like chromosome segregation protein Spo0J